MNKQRVKELALSNGFKLKEQPGGVEDLNPYVYEFAAALVETVAAERDALAAQVEALRGVLQCFHPENFEYMPNSFDLGDDVIEALAATPQQHLAERDAQKGRDGFIAGYMLCNDDSPLIKHNYEGFADKYADSIRQEKK